MDCSGQSRSLAQESFIPQTENMKKFSGAEPAGPYRCWDFGNVLTKHKAKKGCISFA